MSSSSDSVRCVMRVRWFDRRKGYGFLVPTNQALESDSQDETVFVYHNQIRTMYMKNIFRMLYAGEYVECELGKDENDRTVANNVTGIQDGPLMCEVRTMNQQSQNEDDEDAPESRGRSYGGGGRGRGGGGRGGRGRGRASGPHSRIADTSGLNA